jgi:hypothetical protein
VKLAEIAQINVASHAIDKPPDDLCMAKCPTTGGPSQLKFTKAQSACV